jgi:hypothetical protein
VKKTQVFEGNVQLVKGTLVIRAERIVVSQDDDGYQRGVATGTAGTPPRFRQKREGQDDLHRRRRPSASSTMPGPRRPSSSIAPGSRADWMKCAVSSFPTTR